MRVGRKLKESLRCSPGAPPRCCAPVGGHVFPGYCAVDAAPDPEEVAVSRFTDKMFHNARTSTKGMVTGEPTNRYGTPGPRFTNGPPDRRRAGGRRRPGDAVGVLAGAPVEIALTAQALWMRGASLTMLHQPTPHRPGAVGAGHHQRHRHDRGQGRRDLRSVPGRRSGARGARVKSSPSRIPRRRTGRPGADR